MGRFDHSDEYRRVVACRAELLLDAPFFGTLVLKLRLREDASCDTAWTDGTTVGFNPSFTAPLSKAQVKGLLAHEALHCAFGHCWRRGSRNPRKFNVAADYAINPVLVDAGFQLPEGGLLDAQYRGHSAEWIYDRLPETGEQQAKQQGNQPGSGQPGAPQPGEPGQPESGDKGDSKTPGKPEPDKQTEQADDPGGMGEVRDAPEPTEGDSGDGDDSGPVQTEEDWAQARDMAERVALSQGKMPGGLRSAIGEAKRPKVDWQSVLRRFMQQACAADYTWQRPNKRYSGSGFILPTLHTPQCGRLAIGLDTSGSVDQVTLQQMVGEINSIAQDVNPTAIDVYYFHSIMWRHDSFAQGEAVVLADQIESGGTSFVPVFDAIAKGDDTPTAIVMLTDLYGTFPDDEPDAPVLWAVTGRADHNPWGELVPVE